jgi:hypothetical protein
MISLRVYEEVESRRKTIQSLAHVFGRRGRDGGAGSRNKFGGGQSAHSIFLARGK